MSMSVSFSSIKENLVEFKDQVAQRASENPVAAVALVAIPFLALAFLAVWGARKVYQSYNPPLAVKVDTFFQNAMKKATAVVESGIEYATQAKDYVKALDTNTKVALVGAVVVPVVGYAIYNGAVGSTYAWLTTKANATDATDAAKLIDSTSEVVVETAKKIVTETTTTTIEHTVTEAPATYYSAYYNNSFVQSAVNSIKTKIFG